jgi:hypothetical protein
MPASVLAAGVSSTAMHNNFTPSSNFQPNFQQNFQQNSFDTTSQFQQQQQSLGGYRKLKSHFCFNDRFFF